MKVVCVHHFYKLGFYIIDEKLFLQIVLLLKRKPIKLFSCPNPKQLIQPHRKIGLSVREW